MPSITQFRRGSSLEWSSSNPVLAAGEIGIELNTRRFKIGNGSTTWNSLSYAGIPGGTGANGTGTDTAGSIQYSRQSTAPSGWLRCDGGQIPASSYPNLVGKLPSKPGFPGGVGAQFGTANSLGINITVSSTLETDQYAYSTGIQNLTEGKGSWDPNHGYDAPVWHSNSDMPGTWVQYNFPTAVVITGYFMTARSGSWIPTGWEFQGSNDGINWTIIQALYGQYPTYSFSTSLSTAEMSAYSSGNSTPYTKYRLVFYTNNAGYGYIALSELAMVGPAVAEDPSVLVLPDLPTINTSGVSLYAHIKV